MGVITEKRKSPDNSQFFEEQNHKKKSNWRREKCKKVMGSIQGVLTGRFLRSIEVEISRRCCLERGTELGAEHRVKPGREKGQVKDRRGENFSMKQGD